MIRSSSKEDSEAGDGPALPPSANWARTTHERSRRGSHATSLAASSPAISTALPATTESSHEVNEVPTVSESSRKAEKQRADTPANHEPAPSRAQSPKLPAHLDFSYFFRELSSLNLEVFLPLPDPGDKFPPFFDINGAARRRAMRDEGENRVGDQDDQVDNLTQSDGELESGSLALGGEPEDREQARSGLSYDQRRNAPIQRGASNDLFGPSLTGFGQASTTVGSIGSRTMTPQQQLFMRPQNSFSDQMPPGISPQQTSQPASLFQGQGHTRQQSRFSFANDNSASSVNVKSAGDPRYMAQQSSMMPSTYRSQPGGQLYTTSVSGPPPGLKSTGTPPVGGMFGQGHAFGGSAFGSASKGNPNELLQSLIRSNVGNQAHDGKREYMFPQVSSFHNQFPSSTSSTPAPAPGLLATLYAQQPGAFPDYGPKQKKKGKKHRHANTSSSGGSGLVDLADPSILQARMHHQQQGSNMGAGQGLFGGQTQDDDLLLLDEASSAVDALVSDSYTSESRDSLRLDSVLPPSPPPGLGFSHAHPSSVFGGKIDDRIQSPVSQDRPHSRSSVVRPLSTATPRPVTPLALKTSTKPIPVRGKADPTGAGIDAKKSIQELATTSGLAQDIAAQASKSKARLLQEEDFPALDSVKAASPSKTSTTLSKPSQTTKAPPSKKAAVDTSNKSPSETKPKRSERRPVPGILDIAAATNPVAQQPAAKKAEIQDKASAPISVGNQSGKTPVTPALPTTTPTTASVSSPLAKAAAAKKAAEELEWRKNLEAEAKLKAEIEARKKIEDEKAAAEAAKAAEDAKKKADDAFKKQALEEAKAKAEEANRKNLGKDKAPIRFKDAVGRKFSFPYHICQTWQGMEDLIKQAFLHVDIIGPHVQAGHYDLIGPNGEIILPQVWDKVIEPDWQVTMHMWPMDRQIRWLGVVAVAIIGRSDVLHLVNAAAFGASLDRSFARHLAP
ncbi:hypothetical protein NUW58_g9242 [Xylaria curta]|uniref:Uncharacterized protein n=1 Tax=Xylaria curta TaxID=42375 RepID=A0ACC1N0K0_9PEZI|nr:hypothetical protein NUW58_g9242 [Xylaria curta]